MTVPAPVVLVVDDDASVLKGVARNCKTPWPLMAPACPSSF
jgi:hypothetical protein